MGCADMLCTSWSTEQRLFIKHSEQPQSSAHSIEQIEDGYSPGRERPVWQRTEDERSEQRRTRSHGWGWRRPRTGRSASGEVRRRGLGCDCRRPRVGRGRGRLQRRNCLGEEGVGIGVPVWWTRDGGSGVAG
jgi:hypothetical protein